MFLIRCPNCRKIINTKAHECPKCGYSFNRNSVDTTNEQRTVPPTINPKDETRQQVKYLEVLMNMWLQTGSDLWDFNEIYESPASIVAGNKTYTSHELNDYAVQCKRKGEYAESIGAYIRIFDSFYKKNHKLPYSSVRGLIKALICTNDFYDAFVFASTALADAQNRYDIHPAIFNILKSDFVGLETLAKRVVDDNDSSDVFRYAANFSGSNNYQLQKSQSEIKEEMVKVRADIKKYTGN